MSWKKLVSKSQDVNDSLHRLSDCPLPHMEIVDEKSLFRKKHSGVRRQGKDNEKTNKRQG